MAFTKDSYDYDDFSIATNFENLEENDKQLRKNEAGTSAPGDPDAGQLWYYNGASYTGLRTRSNSSTWIKVLCGDASHMIWVYRSDTCEGWRLSTASGDRVLAVSGGSNAYDVTGGSAGGSWSQSGHTHAAGTYAVNGNHTHKWYNFVDGNNNGQTYDSDGVITDIPGGLVTSGLGKQFIQRTSMSSGDGYSLGDSYVADAGNNQDIDGTSASGNEASTYRPAAYVGTLQYPDLRT